MKTTKRFGRTKVSALGSLGLALTALAVSGLSSSAYASDTEMNEKECYSVIFDMISDKNSPEVPQEAIEFALNLERKVNDGYDPKIEAAPDWCGELKGEPEPTVKPKSMQSLFNWTKTSDEMLLREGVSLLDSWVDGQTYVGAEHSARGSYDRFQYVCERGNIEGCTNAVVMARDHLNDKDLEIATYETGCKAGNFKFCGAGYMLTSYPSKPNYNRAKAEYFAQAGCDLEDAFLCKSVAWLKENPVLTEDNARSMID
jgi:hypothetical protein